VAHKTTSTRRSQLSVAECAAIAGTTTTTIRLQLDRGLLKSRGLAVDADDFNRWLTAARDLPQGEGRQ